MTTEQKPRVTETGFFEISTLTTPRWTILKKRQYVWDQRDEVKLAEATRQSSTTCGTAEIRWHGKYPSLGQKEFFRYINGIGCIMRVAGLLPVKLVEHTAELSFDGGWLVYSLLLYFCMLLAVIGIFYYSVPRFLSSETTFNNKLYIGSNLIILNIIIVLPLAYWFNVLSIIRYVKRWTMFLARFERTLGCYPNFGGNRCTIRAVYIYIGITIALLIFLSLTYPKKYYLLFEAVGIVVLTASTTTVWYLNCRAIRITADHLSDQIVQISPNYTVGYVEEVLSLWLDLCALLKSTGSTFTSLISPVLIIAACSMTVASFGHATRIIDGSFSLTILSSLIFQIWDLLNLYIVCDSAYIASNSVTKYLLCVKINQPVIQLAGIIEVNRNFLIKVCSTIATYLVVLVQFQLTMPYQL